MTKRLKLSILFLAVLATIGGGAFADTSFVKDLTGHDKVIDIGADSLGNTYVLGIGGGVAVLRKYDSTGAVLIADQAISEIVEPVAMHVIDGNVPEEVEGRIFVASTRRVFRIIENPDGQFVVEHTSGGIGPGDIALTDLVYHPGRNQIIVCGQNPPSTRWPRIGTLAADLTVATAVTPIRGLGGAGSTCHSIVVDDAGDLYVCGKRKSNGMRYVYKFDGIATDGNGGFTQKDLYESAGGEFTDMVFRRGWVHAVGTTTNANPAVEVARLDTTLSGSPRKVTVAKSGTALSARSITADEDGNVYFCGTYGPGATKFNHKTAPEEFLELSSSVTSLFVAKLDTEMEYSWVKTPRSAPSSGFGATSKVRWNGGIQRVFFGGALTGSTADPKPIMVMGEADSEVSLPVESDSKGFLSAIDPGGIFTQQVRLTIISDFGESRDQVVPFGLPDLGESMDLIKGSTINASVPRFLYRDIGNTDITDAIEDDEAARVATAETRIRSTGFSINDNVPEGDARSHTFELREETTINFNWAVDYALRVDSDLSGTASPHTSGEEPFVPVLESKATGAPEPQVQKHWIPAETEISPSINGAEVDLFTAPGLGVRYIVRGFDASGAALASNSPWNLFENVEPRQQVTPFVMNEPTSITYKWQLQFGVSVNTGNPLTAALPRVQVVADPPNRDANLATQEDGEGEATHWFDPDSSLIVGTPGVDPASNQQLSGWVNGDGFYFASSGDPADLDGTFSEGGVEYKGVVIPKLRRPARVAWNYGQRVFVETVVIGQKVQLNTLGSQPVLGEVEPTVTKINDSPEGSSASDMVTWDPEGKVLYPLRPGEVETEWRVSEANPEDTITLRIIIVWGPAHYNHIANTPGVSLNPDPNDNFVFDRVAYTQSEAVVGENDEFTAAGVGRSVLLFNEISEPGRGGVPKPFLRVRVVETKGWDDGVGSPVETVIGEAIQSSLDKAGLDTGYTFFEDARYNPFVYNRDRFTGRALFNEDERPGPVIPVNLFPGATAEQRIVVVWYDDPDDREKMLWPYKAEIYEPKWPTEAEGLQRIVIASRFGNESVDSDGNDQLVTPAMTIDGVNLAAQPNFNPGRFKQVTVYNQPHSDLTGYNPNEEHAVLAPSLRSITATPQPPAVYALRDSDLNISAAQISADSRLGDDDYTSDPYVLVQFLDSATNQPRMKVYQIEKDDSANGYEFTQEMEAGEPVIPFYPLVNVIGATPCASTYIREGTPTRRTVMRDVKGTDWAVSGEGQFGAFFYYPLLPDFWWPTDLSERFIGDCVSFLPTIVHTDSYAAHIRATADQEAFSIDYRRTTAIPAAQQIIYDTIWPEVVPVLKVGETLTYPGGEYRGDFPTSQIEDPETGELETVETPGLPGAIGWAAGEVVFDDLNPAMDEALALTNFSARVYAPLVERTVPLPIEDFPSELLPAGGRIRVSGVEYVFSDLSSSLQKRIFYNPISGLLGIRGFLNDKDIGDPTLTAAPPAVYVLEPNVLTSAEFQELQSLASGAFATAAAALYKLSINPGGIDANSNGDADQINFAGIDPLPVRNSAGRFAVASLLQESTDANVLAAVQESASNLNIAIAANPLRQRSLWYNLTDGQTTTFSDELGLDDGVKLQMRREFTDDQLFIVNQGKPAQGLGPGIAVTANPKFLDPNGTLPDGSAFPQISYVTIAENNHPDLQGAPITMHIIKIDRSQRYRGAIKTVLSDNVFDENIILRHTGDFAANAKDLVFEWWYRPEDGTTSRPPDAIPAGETSPWKLFANQEPEADAVHPGQNFFQLKLKGNPSAPEALLADTLFFVRYRHKDEAPADQVKWAPPSFQWAGAGNSTPRDVDLDGFPDYRAQLAQGWIKRVLDAINPYEARIRDFTGNNPATYSSLIQQLGAAFEGAVALNPDQNVIENVGLIELYETILKRGRDLSIDLSTPVATPAIFNALQLVSTRLSEFYTALGNEAYTDALDPSIGFGSDSVEYGALSPTVHAFQNMTSSISEEELALLRGVDDFFGRPVYNRLFWNFVRGEGEAAYALNYNISDINTDGFVDEDDAMILFPQGHGDSWGHYLTAVRMQYELLRHENFNWQPRAELYNLQDIVIPVDFIDERKFATAAAAKARAATRIVNLTYRTKYVEDPQGQWQGYKDTDPNRAWGVEGWARRAGQGSYFDWVTANALLPTNHPDPDAEGIQKVDRTTTGGIASISANLGAIQSTFDEANNGLNPLGLATNVVPFDIDPARVDRGNVVTATHFEQIYERALAALKNARAVYDDSNKHRNMLRKVANTEEQFRRNVFEEDLSYRNRLINIFGTPYNGTIGSGLPYPPGFIGPDLLLHAYIDVRQITESTVPTTTLNSSGEGFATDLSAAQSVDFGITGVDDEVLEIFAPSFTTDNATDYTNTFGNVNYTNFGDDADTRVPLQNMNLPITTSGYSFQAPLQWGQRASPGKLQLHLNKMLQKEAELARAIAAWDGLQGEIIRALELIGASRSTRDSLETRMRNLVISNSVLNAARLALTISADVSGTAIDALGDLSETVSTYIPVNLPTGGFSISPGDALSAARGATRTGFEAASISLRITKVTLESIEKAIALAQDIATMVTDLQNFQDERDLGLRQALVEVENLTGDEAILRVEIFRQQEALRELSDQYRKMLNEGARLVDERDAYNKRVASMTQRNRYQDIMFRTARNASLQKYEEAFDLAARYVYLAAKAYDYETNLRPGEAGSAQLVLRNIVRTRCLGLIQDGEPQPRGNGLAAQLAWMNANFEVLKGQLGVNNPSVETGKFSLRHENFRLREGSDAAWAGELASHEVTDLWELDAFRRYCRPFAAETDGAGNHVPQPGIVIPFSTEIRPGKNLFGQDLGDDDHFFDASNFSTKIRSVGVWLESDNATDNGLPETPRVYLVPVGIDMMLYPDSETLEVRPWQVLDQRIPVPFPATDTEINELTWQPADNLDGLLGEPRRFSTMRAYHDDGVFDENQLEYNSRLIGRSVWNTQWLLIIPGQSLHEDPEIGIETLLYGPGRDPSIPDGVSDIKLYFQTYGYSGR